MKGKTWDKIGTITYYTAFVAQTAFIVCAFASGWYGEAAWAALATLWMCTHRNEERSRRYWFDRTCELAEKNDKLCDIVMGQQEKYSNLLDKYNALLAQKTAVVKVEGKEEE